MKIASRFLKRACSARLSLQIMVTATSTHLTSLVRRLIEDPTTSTAIRNECHRLLIAIDCNHQLLVEERLAHLTQLLDAAKIKVAQ